jgi:hypothetical protein
MHTHLSEKEVKGLLDNLKKDVHSLKEGTGSLDFAFESATKHMPVYLKIVKSHIDQLAKVLELETHNHRNLENVGLAEPVVQLIQLFRELDEDDIQLLDTLAAEARHWRQNQIVEEVLEKAIATEA